MLNFSYENEFGLHGNEPLGGTHFRMNGFPQRLVLMQKQKPTWKWPVQHGYHDVTTNVKRIVVITSS